MTFKTTFPELTQGQLNLLERMMLEVIGEDSQETDDPKHHNYWINLEKTEQRKRLEELLK